MLPVETLLDSTGSRENCTARRRIRPIAITNSGSEAVSTAAVDRTESLRLPARRAAYAPATNAIGNAIRKPARAIVTERTIRGPTRSATLRLSTSEAPQSPVATFPSHSPYRSSTGWSSP